MKQDPMKQLTGTFNPTIIKDIEEWYSEGGFYKSSNIIKGNVHYNIHICSNMFHPTLQSIDFFCSCHKQALQIPFFRLILGRLSGITHFEQ